MPEKPTNGIAAFRDALRTLDEAINAVDETVANILPTFTLLAGGHNLFARQ
jgi:hypothetical protein